MTPARLAAVLLLAASAATALPPLRDPQPVSPMTYGPSIHAGGYSRAASDGANFLIVTAGQTISATHVSPSGQQLDSPGINILHFAPNQGLSRQGLDVIYAGGQYVIAYSVANSVVTMTLPREGRPAVDVRNTVAGVAYENLRLAWNGRNVLLFMGNSRVRLLDVNGAPVSPEQPLPLTDLVGGDLASNGDGFLITGGSGKKAWCIPVDAGGRLGAARVLSDIDAYWTSVASDGRDYLVIACFGPQPGAACRFIVHGDDVSGPTAVTGTLAGPASYAVWTGSEYVAVFWPRGVRVQTYRRDGSLKGDSLFQPYQGPSFDATFLHGLQTNGSQCLLWGFSNPNMTVGYLFDPDRSPTRQSSTAVALLNRARDQFAAATATNGSEALLVWIEETGLVSGDTVRGVRIEADGTVGKAFDIALGVSRHSPPAVASNGRDFVVAWQDLTSTDIYTRGVTREGTLLPIVPVHPGAGGDVPSGPIAVAWSGRAYVVVWAKDRTVYAGTSEGSSTPTVRPAMQNDGASISIDNLAIACSTSAGCVAVNVPFWRDGVVTARLSADGVPLGQQSFMTVSVRSSFLLLPRDDDVFLLTELNAGSVDSYLCRISLLKRTVSPFDGLTDVYGWAVVGDGFYFTPPYSAQLSWTHLDRLTSSPSGPVIDVDVVSPTVITETSEAVCVVVTIFDDSGSARLFVRTYARPARASQPPRRRVAR